MPEYFLIAEIKSFFNDGYVSLFSYSDFPERFFDLKKIYINLFGDMRTLTVEDVRDENDIFIKIMNFDAEEELKFLLGEKIYVNSENAVKLPDGKVFIHDLIGSRVFRNHTFFGYLNDYFQLTTNDVFAIEDTNGNEILVPVITDYIESFDSENKILTLKPGDFSFYDDED